MGQRRGAAPNWGARCAGEWGTWHGSMPGNSAQVGLILAVGGRWSAAFTTLVLKPASYDARFFGCGVLKTASYEARFFGCGFTAALLRMRTQARAPRPRQRGGRPKACQVCLMNLTTHPPSLPQAHPIPVAFEPRPKPRCPQLKGGSTRRRAWPGEEMTPPAATRHQRPLGGFGGFGGTGQQSQEPSNSATRPGTYLLWFSLPYLVAA